jgi:acetoin utilization deacetylase AcuC-like enzyme
MQPHHRRKRKTAIVRDEVFLEHLVTRECPEKPDRLRAIYDHLDSCGLAARLTVLPRQTAPRDLLTRVHADAYVDRVLASAASDYTSLSADTGASRNSGKAALLAAGGTVAAVEGVCGGRFANAFVLARPPGHHAEKSRAMGYCLFNNIALGARFARDELGLARVMIVDWDVHHGNGTQHLFEADPTVLFFSVHQHPLFPGSGLFTEIGIRSGEGYTCNIPLPKGCGEIEYAGILSRLLVPMAKEFHPELVLVSAGFDIHPDDPLGGMRVSRNGFAAMARILLDLADDCCNGRIVFCLEGGYDYQALASGVAAVLDEMSGSCSPPAPSAAPDRSSDKKLAYATDRCRQVHRRFWQCFH